MQLRFYLQRAFLADLLTLVFIAAYELSLPQYDDRGMPIRTHSLHRSSCFSHVFFSYYQFL